MNGVLGIKIDYCFVYGGSSFIVTFLSFDIVSNSTNELPTWLYFMALILVTCTAHTRPLIQTNQINEKTLELKKRKDTVSIQVLWYIRSK